MTATDIANRALAAIDLEPIVSIEDPKTPEARRVAAVWRLTFETFLAERSWSFATRRDKPARLAVSDVDDMHFPHAFAQPEDLIRLISAEPEQHDRRGRVFNYMTASYGENRRPAIFATHDPIIIRYVSNKAKIADMHPMAREALALRLAVDLCLDLHNNTGRANTIMQRYAAALGQAAKADYQTHELDTVRAHGYNAARFIY